MAARTRHGLLPGRPGCRESAARRSTASWLAQTTERARTARALRASDCRWASATTTMLDPALINRFGVRSTIPRHDESGREARTPVGRVMRSCRVGRRAGGSGEPGAKADGRRTTERGVRRPPSSSPHRSGRCVAGLGFAAPHQDALPRVSRQSFPLQCRGPGTSALRPRRFSSSR